MFIVSIAKKGIENKKVLQYIIEYTKKGVLHYKNINDY